MNSRSIKIKLSYNELEALMMAYQTVVDYMVAESRTEVYTPTELLLLELASVMRDKLERKHSLAQLKNTLALTAVEAMGIYQLWQRPFAITRYSGNAVRKVYAEIDKKHKSATWIVQ